MTRLNKITIACFMAGVFTLSAGAQQQNGLITKVVADFKAPSAATPAKVATPLDGLEEKINGMKTSIEAAIGALGKANAPATERAARLDAVIASLDNSIAELGESGQLYGEIGKAVDGAKELQNKYKDKVLDPNIEARIREKYQILIDKSTQSVNSLVDKRMLLGKAHRDLQGRRNTMAQEKDFILDMIQADELAVANESLNGVLLSVRDVVRSIDDLAASVSEEPAVAGKEQQ